MWYGPSSSALLNPPIQPQFHYPSIKRLSKVKTARSFKEQVEVRIPQPTMSKGELVIQTFLFYSQNLNVDAHTNPYMHAHTYSSIHVCI
jgi:poly-beta-hydroxyalkanoate depolymerase